MQQTARITIEHNLFVDATNGIQIGGGVADFLRVAHNAWPAIAGSLY